MSIVELFKNDTIIRDGFNNLYFFIPVLLLILKQFFAAVGEVAKNNERYLVCFHKLVRLERRLKNSVDSEIIEERRKMREIGTPVYTTKAQYKICMLGYLFIIVIGNTCSSKRNKKQKK